MIHKLALLILLLVNVSMAAKNLEQYKCYQKKYVITDAIVGEDGLTIDIENTNTPLDNVMILIPKKAFTKKTKVSIGYEEGGFFGGLEGQLSGIVIFFETQDLKRFENPIEISVPISKKIKNSIGIAGYAIVKNRLTPLSMPNLDKLNNRVTFISFMPLKFTWIYY